MATTIRFKPLFPLSPLPKQSNSPLTSWLSLPISRPLSHHRRYVAVSVAFNPQGNFDVSLFDDDGKNNNTHVYYTYFISYS